MTDLVYRLDKFTPLALLLVFFTTFLFASNENNQVTDIDLELSMSNDQAWVWGEDKTDLYSLTAIAKLSTTESAKTKNNSIISVGKKANLSKTLPSFEVSLLNKGKSSAAFLEKDLDKLIVKVNKYRAKVATLKQTKKKSKAKKVAALKQTKKKSKAKKVVALKQTKKKSKAKKVAALKQTKKKSKAKKVAALKQTKKKSRAKNKKKKAVNTKLAKKSRVNKKNKAKSRNIKYDIFVSSRSWKPKTRKLVKVYKKVANSGKLSKKALTKAFKYYEKHKSHKGLSDKYLVVADYTKSSKSKRMHLINLKNGRVSSYLVAHGKRSGPVGGRVYSTSNRLNSHMTSKGFFKVGYKEGRTLKKGYKYLSVTGLERGNRKVGLPTRHGGRDVVIHTASYVNRGGRSFGCFAIRPQDKKRVFGKIKGALFYSYAG